MSKHTYNTFQEICIYKQFIHERLEGNSSVDLAHTRHIEYNRHYTKYHSRNTILLTGG